MSDNAPLPVVKLAFVATLVAADAAVVHFGVRRALTETGSICGLVAIALWVVLTTARLLCNQHTHPALRVGITASCAFGFVLAVMGFALLAIE